MMKAQHTPGPWTYLPESDIVGAPTTRHDEDGTHHDLRYPLVIAHLPDDWDQSRHGPLIAAAPAMLAALKEAAEALGCLGHRDGQRRGPMADRIRAAIAAAEGE